MVREPSDVGRGPKTALFAIRFAAVLPDLVEAAAAERYDVMIVTQKPTRHAQRLGGSIRLARLGLRPTDQIPERREVGRREEVGEPGSLHSRPRDRILQRGRLGVVKRPEREERRAVLGAVQAAALLCGRQDDRLGKRPLAPRVAAEQRVLQRDALLRAIPVRLELRHAASEERARRAVAQQRMAQAVNLALLGERVNGSERHQLVRGELREVLDPDARKTGREVVSREALLERLDVERPAHPVEPEQE